MLLGLAAILWVLPWVSGQLLSGPQDIESTDLNCNDTSDCFENAVCKSGMCDCKQGYKFYETEDTLIKSCRECPGPHDTCDTCCSPANSTECHNKVCVCLDNNDSYACSIFFQRDEFRLATEICFGAAMSMVLLSLVIYIAKSWQKRRDNRRRDAQRARTSSATSLTSVQRLVAQRMLDRPPGYNDRRHIRIEKPPSYEDAVALQVSSLPVPVSPERPREVPGRAPAHPPRTLASVLEDVEDESAGAVGGVINPAFVATRDNDDEYHDDDGCASGFKNTTTTELHI